MERRIVLPSSPASTDAPLPTPPPILSAPPRKSHDLRELAQLAALEQELRASATSYAAARLDGATQLSKWADKIETSKSLVASWLSSVAAKTPDPTAGAATTTSIAPVAAVPPPPATLTPPPAPEQQPPPEPVVTPSPSPAGPPPPEPAPEPEPAPQPEPSDSSVYASAPAAVSSSVGKDQPSKFLSSAPATRFSGGSAIVKDQPHGGQAAASADAELSTGAKVGIGIGALVAVGVLCWLIACCLARRRRRSVITEPVEADNWEGAAETSAARPVSLPSEAYIAAAAASRRHTRKASNESAISIQSTTLKDETATNVPLASKAAIARPRRSRFSHLPPIPTRQPSVAAPSEGTSIVDASRASVSEATPALPYKAARRTMAGSASPFS